jgi:hypothetical protein
MTSSTGSRSDPSSGAPFGRRLRAANAIAGNEKIHLLRICTDNEINVVVKGERLCLLGDHYIDF